MRITIKRGYDFGEVLDRARFANGPARLLRVIRVSQNLPSRITIISRAEEVGFEDDLRGQSHYSCI